MSLESISARVPEEVFKSDFDLGFYSLENLNADTVETHVRSFFGEKLMKPRRERLWVGRDGTLAPDYVEMMERSIKYWQERGDDKAVLRFEKELEGARNAVSLIIATTDKNEPLPIVINASDPGDFYVDKEGRKKSMTFVWIKESTSESGWKYSVYSLPTAYIGIEKHWAMLKKLGDLQRTQEILKNIFNEDELSANSVIAFPLIVSNLTRGMNEIADELGYASWDEIEQMAANQLELEKDPYARERREGMVDEFTHRILDTVKGYRSQDEKEALVNAMADMFALEAGKEYLGWSKEKIVVEMEKNIRLALADKLKLFDKPQAHYHNWSVELGDLAELYVQRTWMMNAFRNNPLAREARATGCGGSGMSMSNDVLASLNASSFMDKMNITDTTQFDYWTNIAGQVGNGEFDTSTSSTGKYTEYYNYEPGTCTNCHEHKPYVAHPKSADIQCAGWCSDCET